jgi:Icc-related predicted phosphoesterase
LITHGPPWGIQDWVGRERVGCADLRAAVEYRLKPALHVFGHVHGGYGQYILGSTRCVNASVVNEKYHVVNAPIVIDL